MLNPLIQVSHLKNIEWLNSSECSFIAQEGTHVWHISIRDYLPVIDDMKRLLSADEVERANRYHQEKDRERFVISRAGLRLLLGQYTVTPPQNIIFELGKNKKPHVKGINVPHYNVSHSGDHVLIAIAGEEVGIDVEYVNPDLEYREIMQICFSQKEVDYVNTAKNTAESFYTLWTRKEALLKATATGITDSLKIIPCLLGNHVTSYDIIGSEKSWQVLSFIVNNHYIGALALSNSKTSFFELIP